MKKYILFSSLMYVIAYVIASFVEWDFTWIENMSNWGKDGRCGFLFVCICKEMICIFIWDTTNVKDYFSIVN